MTNINGSDADVAVKTGGSAEAVAKAHASITESSPVRAMRRLFDDLDRTFADWSLGKDWTTPLWGREALAKRIDELGKEAFLPDVEVVENEGTMTVRADLPGVRKEDIEVELTRRSVILKGERHREEEKRAGYYRSERSYGTFYRCIPVRDGLEADEARATFKDGVLEVTVKTHANSRRVAIQ